ncbi:MAG: alpha/beta hydrolase [Parafilimonas sp.]|nr:alpha/beta hydrolase [Parafilimonas sp.]
MKHILLNLLFLLPVINSFSQNIHSLKYKDIVFDKIDVQKDLLFSSADSIKESYRQFDLYQPANDSSIQKRPLIIWLHGGGFKYGTKNAKEIKIWGNEFAKRGYVVAALNYRLSKEHPVRKFKDLVEACYDAVDDMQTAINYFKTNANNFKIDTSKIILGGNSAGAVIALQTVYSNRADLQNVIDSNKTIANTNNYNSLNIAAIVNFWGALFDDDWLSRANVPIVSVAGAKDKIVPIDTKGVAFFGALAIHKKANSVHILNDIKIYKEYGHELQKRFNPFFRSDATKQRWREAAEFSSNFLYKTLFKKN